MNVVTHVRLLLVAAQQITYKTMTAKTDQSVCGSRRSEIRLGVKLDSESQIELTVMAVKVSG